MPTTDFELLPIGADLPRVKGKTIVHQHDTDQRCGDHRYLNGGPPCRYEPTVWARLKARFRRQESA